jgi:hypothetical protein
MCINLSWIHTRHDADTLLASLISIERWTPYYWGDNRLGSLLPLLASFVREYVPNMLLQTQISVFATLAAAVVFQCFFLDREHGLTLRNLSAACLTIIFAIFVLRPGDRVIRMFLLAPHPYFVSLSLALTGLVILLRCPGPRVLRYTTAGVALLLSFWVNWTNVPVIAALALLLRARVPALLLIAAAFLAMYSYSLRFPRLMVTGMLSISEMPVSASRMLENASVDMFYPNRIALLLVAAVVASVIRWRRDSGRKLLGAHEAQGIIAIAVAFAAAIASTEWVVLNLYEWRYWTVPMVLIFLVVASFLADSAFGLLEYISGSTSVTAALLVLAMGAVVIRVFGVPSISTARQDLEAVSRANYDKVRSLNCTHMIGDYWVAWSSVFYNRSRNIQPPLWAVSLRSEETQDLWSRIPPAERRYCGICGDRMNNYYEIIFKLAPLRHTDQSGNLCLYQK